MRPPPLRGIFPRLVTRRNYQSRWVWELLAQDRHVLNRSDSDFATKAECEAHALENGQTLPVTTRASPHVRV
ncbi:MAG: hypothetical protein QOK44_433 [Betaproteobacteria bacterium]|jgi:hypothetical protein|nr:hypothetical protein [Betaproteobacteria bacterium]